MIILPAIDLFGGQAVRLYQGDYNQMTVYDADPLHTVAQFEAAGATHLHLVDLEGAKTGQTTNLPTIERIAAQTGLFVEVGGGIRSMDTVRRYLEAGASRVILGTAAVTDPDFTAQAVAQYGDKIAVGADLKDGKVAIKGWLETSQNTWETFFDQMQALGVRTMICTDISRDGAMEGTNRALYRTLAQRYSMDIIASGGVSSLEDIRALKAAGVAGANIGKAYYTGANDQAQAIALDYLQTHGLWSGPMASVGVGPITSGETGGDTILGKNVYCFPAVDGAPVEGVFRIVVTLDPTGKVVTVHHLAAQPEQPREVPLKSRAQLASDLTRGNYSSNLYQTLTDPVVETCTLRLYADATPVEGQTYLYPVYVLTGHGTMPDGTTEWFEVIVDAQA